MIILYRLNKPLVGGVLQGLYGGSVRGLPIVRAHKNLERRVQNEILRIRFITLELWALGLTGAG